ncbi:E3 ubiquitin-protein ligase MARCHF6 [Acropora cervicornis]|uniref:E3 ubiquitin-protein ligase MARCHF6 n=1 Tax=Acropora cervicornis TaxID=6130 RepID=A0AAD9Q517_ACRCE|nr:E3 ubiquitin-protein ligase MARCHF6 [Acropora cervicornis]
MEDGHEVDICRVCRAEGSHERPLYHPCICTGSIKFIHQDCLVQWLKHSKKEYCELCNHHFSFKPIYRPDMPTRLPISDFVSGLVKNILRALKYWLHYTLVALAWLGVVPITAYRIYRCLFAGSVNSLLTLPLDMLSTENLFADCIRGCFVVACTLCAFISLVWLREQILMNGGPEWLEPNPNDAAPQAAPANNEAGGAAGDAGQGGGGEENPNNAEEHVAEEENMANQDVGNAAHNGEDDGNWINPVEWERAAEELTWERMLGLDGSLVFLCPHEAPRMWTLEIPDSRAAVKSNFTIVMKVHTEVFHEDPSQVSLLMLVEIGLFPLVCGWWLDICSLSLFGVTLKDRLLSVDSAPGTAMFLHWLVGMVYVFYFASFVLLLREVLRPGVLWFLRNLNDPDFQPVQEMIRLPVYRHSRRFLLSLVVFGTTVLLMMYLPVRIIKWLLPTFLPYNVQLSSEVPVSELSLELLLLQVVLPALLEQGHTRQWLKKAMRGWAVAVAFILNLRSYLLGDVPLDGSENVYHYHNRNNQQNANRPQHGNAAAAAAAGQNAVQAQPAAGHAAAAAAAAAAPAADGTAAIGFQPYIRPPMFTFKILMLVLLMCFSLSFASFVTLTGPVFIGRSVMKLWMGDASVHELYTAACGLYFIWLVCRLGSVLFSWVPLGWGGVALKLFEWFVLGLKCVIVALALIGLVPLLLGLLFELVVVAPLRVPLDQTPLFFPWQDWALGVLHMKIICAVTMMGPNWWLKRALEQVYQDGVRNVNVVFIFRHVTLPVVTCLLLAVTIPYVIAAGIIPMIVRSPESSLFCLRRIYPFLLAMFVIVAGFFFQKRQFRLLYERIKNDKYLVGQKLVNYEHARQGSKPASMPAVYVK